MTEQWEEWSGAVRTDLAVEARNYVQHRTNRSIPGVYSTEEQLGHTLVTRVRIVTPQGSSIMGKPMGNYITIESPALIQRNRQLQDEVARVFVDELAALLPPEAGSFFIVGLGNWNATPDALGPRVVDQLLITRHLGDYVPQEVRNRLRSVSALAPGVLGLTGIETGEIIRGIVDRTRPDVVMAIDALASQKVDRLMTTIQISDTGIHPGSGVGNRRVGLTHETLGIPVLAIGIPTVVHALTIAHDAIELLMEQLKEQAGFTAMVNEMGTDQLSHLFDAVLRPEMGELMVTPKEIDVHIMEMARIVAEGLNAALHQGITADNLASYLMK
ncbi:MAG: GPR endopeptidase [Bacillota bacterium]